MIDTLGATLTYAAAIAISPVPVIAVILMLMSARAHRLGFAFLAGWLAGILVATALFTLLADALPAQPGGPQPVVGVIQILLGAGLLLLGWRQWRTRPQPGQTPTLPPWMSKIDSMSVPAAAGLAFALAAVNPKNLLVAAAAGAVIGRAGLDPASVAASVLIFSTLAALSVAIPVVAAALAPRAAARALTGIRTWLTAYNAVIMTVLLLILGVNIIGNGIASL